MVIFARFHRHVVASGRIVSQVQFWKLFRGVLAHSFVRGEIRSGFLTVVEGVRYFLLEFVSFVLKDLRVFAELIGHLTVLRETVHEVVTYTLACDGLVRVARALLEHLLLLFDLSEPGVFQGLRSCYTVVRVVDQKFQDQVLNFIRSVG